MPEFTAGRTYRFAVLTAQGGENGYKSSFKRVYLRHVGKLELFRSPTCRWLESFTREQLGDFQIREVKA